MTQRETDSTTLERTLGLRDLILLVIGTVIGSGIFIVPSAVLRSANIIRAADNHRFGEYYLMWWRIIPK